MHDSSPHPDSPSLPDPRHRDRAPRPSPLRAALGLRCPRCGGAGLFAGWFRMEPRCGRCGLDFRREPGFYLGSIYINYGITALSTIALYGLLVLAGGWTAEQALAACLAVAVALPLVLFRYARALLLAIDSSVNRDPAPAGHGPLTEAQLSSHRANDGQAGCAMGVAMTLVLLFGLLMAVVSLWFAVGPGAVGWEDDDPAATEPAGGPPGG